MCIVLLLLMCKSFYTWKAISENQIGTTVKKITHMRTDLGPEMDNNHAIIFQEHLEYNDDLKCWLMNFLN